MNDYIKNKYIIIDDKIIKSWIKQDKNDKGLYLVDWDKVGQNYIKSCDIYDDYIDNNNYRSKKALGIFLKSNGVITSNKKISGKSVNVYVGIKNI